MLILKFSQKQARGLEYIFLSFIIFFIGFIINSIYVFINTNTLCACATDEIVNIYDLTFINIIFSYAVIIIPFIALGLLIFGIILFFIGIKEEKITEINFNNEFIRFFNKNECLSRFGFLFSNLLMIFILIILFIFCAVIAGFYSYIFEYKQIIIIIILTLFLCISMFIYSSIKRFKDLDMKGYNIFFLLFPIVNLYFLYLLFFKENKKVQN